ncbi:3-hydroxyisobutyrate dehydrogenase-like beta-hydroxyacid dehydrogenase [Neorhizobium sp. R1-B]|uniref:NAD(P)-dependent oxidoreductase n=1 Tax=unclassified Neorhizobium TaxID=2629175 RepID=UPI0010476FCA|nr:MULTISPECIES: NAD(P)-dependent oxidoreductase [unclassified Neorhizobium]TCV70068.1 3-hydroxyisobutyrate dehydrogenase-like beta-hydroxyacid dehydrogenase [Neorhizobium sp. S3-V5DH]TDX80410.1 3-hydroxyisobutyrate dehydrogenase-like beta-hydroxyacid dehydrogenase [Neorhizobium sp. R1-B]
MRIAFLGFGEAARAFHDSLAPKLDNGEFRAYDLLLDDAERAGEMRMAMGSRGVRPEASPAGLADAEWIFSAVTADQSLKAAQSIAPYLGQSALLIDINSVSPGRKRETATLINETGAGYLDMAVMAPVHPKGHATPVLLAGREAGKLLGHFRSLGFEADLVGDAPGAATAIKMVRSVFVKGLEAITVEALLAAEASGCFEEILSSLSRSFPGLDWSRFADYQFERTTRHGRRRAAEMRESGVTLDALGLNGGLAREIAAVQDEMAATGPKTAGNLRQTVARVLAARRQSR